MPDTSSGGAAAEFAQLLFGVITFQAYTTGVRLGVFDELGDTARTSAELAVVLHADQANLHRLLRALAAADLLQYTVDGKFALTAAGAQLRSTNQDGSRDLVALFGEPVIWRSFGALEESVRTGGPAFAAAAGARFFDHFVTEPGFAHRYHAGMRWGTALLAPLVAAGYDWSSSRRIVDVGGGDGSLLAAVLAANGGAQGVVYDTAEALGRLQATLTSSGLSGRCTGETGDFLEKVPAGADTYLLKNVLHEWSDADCVRILGNCREAMAEGGKVLVLATLLPEPGQESVDPAAFRYATLSDLQLMSFTHGERTLSEYRGLCATAGLSIAGVTPLPYLPNDNIIEAIAS